MALGLRPDCTRLLPDSLSGAGEGPHHSCPASVFLHADGIFSRDLSPRDPAPPARAQSKSVPFDPAPVSSPGEPLDSRRYPARSQPQLAQRPWTGPGNSAANPPAHSGSRIGKLRRFRLAPLEP